MNSSLDTTYVLFEIREGILIGTYKKGVKIDIHAAKEIVRSRLQFSNHKSLPALAINLGIIGLDKEARDYFSSPEGLEGIAAGGILIDSPVTTMVSNFYLKVTKPKIPTKVFTDTHLALRWLSKFKN